LHALKTYASLEKFLLTQFEEKIVVLISSTDGLLSLCGGPMRFKV
jgi:hypothetical protein